MAFNTLIDPAALADLIARGTATIIDCGFDLTDPDAGYAAYRADHIPGAAYFHLDRDLSRPSDGRDGRHPLPDRATLARKLAAAGLDAGRQLVAYDNAGGIYAARLWWMARWLGHQAAAVLDGGMAAWRAAGLPIERGDPAPARAGDFVAGRSLAAAPAGADEILASLAEANLLVIDARSPERFAGAPNALDPVAGHIPGARNRFCRDNLMPDGRFKPAAVLAAEYEAVIGDHPLDQVVLQCGSGVTAAHDLLAMEAAGLTGARLYPGSWSEWISDPMRPVARA